MSTASKSEIYFSFFMFTVDLRPEDTGYTEVLIKHLRALTEVGYDGFDMHIAPRSANVDHRLEVESYARLKKEFDKAGLKDKKFATNVGTTQFFDPTSPYAEQRKQALSYLKSRVDITSVLGGEGSIMSGPFIYPYGAFPRTLVNRSGATPFRIGWSNDTGRRIQSLRNWRSMLSRRK
jgi:sugar phosphate isomerase/epimerase